MIDITPNDINEKTKYEKGDPVLYLEYNVIRKRYTLHWGRITELLDDFCRINNFTKHYSHILCILTNDYYCHLLAEEIRNEKKNTELTLDDLLLKLN